VDVSKGHWAWDEYGEGPDEIAAAMQECRSGWFMFGDEWEYQDSAGYPYPMSKQIEEARWYIEKRDEVNPDCKLAFGGILTFHPDIEGRKVAAHWVPAFYDAYLAAYGEPPDIDALVFDDFYWHSSYWSLGYPWWYWEDVTAEAVGVAHDYYGDIEVWAREIGCLERHPGDPDKYPLEAMEQLAGVVQHYDRYAWFISSADSGSYWRHTALWVDGEMTALGEAYRAFERLPPWGP